MNELDYTCPFCSGTISMAEPTLGQKITCPHCAKALYATPSEPAVNTLPEKIPFFKFSRRKLLKSELKRLVEDGEYSKADHNTLSKTALRLDLEAEEITKLRLKEFEEAIIPFKARIYQTAYVTDDDLDFLRALSHKLDLKIEQDPLVKICRHIYLMEVKKENPLVPSSSAELMLDKGEKLYLSMPSGWSQIRVKTSGYAGLSLSLPTGIRGVRFRLGQLTPLRNEQLTLLAEGVLHITSKRLLFIGDRRNTTVTFGRIVGTSLFSDAVEIEKSTGRSDYFVMTALYGRYVSAVIQLLKTAQTN